jgi:TonB family protein
MKRLLVAAMLFWCIAGLSTAIAQNVKKSLESNMPQDYVPYDKGPEAVKQVQAVYPETARKDKLEGTVWVKTLVDVAGKVAQVTVQKSDGKIFEEAAIAAVKQWEFKPALLNGKPVSVWVSIPFRFKLSDGDKSQQLSPSAAPKEKRYPPAEDVKHDKEPELVSQVNPVYPPEAMQSALEGTVYTKMWIDENGHVVEVIVTKSDNEVFNVPSIDAGMKWVFKPALVNGKPVAVWVTVPFRFALAGK